MNVPRERWAADKVYKKEASRKQRDGRGGITQRLSLKMVLPRNEFPETDMPGGWIHAPYQVCHKVIQLIPLPLISVSLSS